MVGAAWLAGAIWRISVLISKWHVPLRLNDSLYYSIQAYYNARGRWFREAGGAAYQYWGVRPGAEHPPLTSIVIAPASLLAHPEFWERATMTAIGIALIPLMAMLGRRVGGMRVGAIAAVITAAYPNIWMSDALIMSETLLLFLVVVVMLLALRHRDRFDLGSALALGVAIGIAGHARSEVLLFAPLLALVGVRTHELARWMKTAAVMLLATGFTVLPWIVYNTTRFHETVLMSTNEGTTWLGANCNDAYYGAGTGGWSLDCLIESDPPADESTAARSTRRRHEAFAYAETHKSRLPVVAAARILRAADLYGLGDLVHGDEGEERPWWAIWLGIVCWWALAPMAAIGVWRTRRGVRYVLLAPVITVLVVTLAFYGAHRLRASMEPIVVVGAASFLASTSLGRRWPRARFDQTDTAPAEAMADVG
ncbi:MAG: glycosyl transferase, family 39 [Acidimicrobiales bacterium]|nr:glycosyl transferase, family 39 [Acidimicrobiales bacterium]